MAESEAAPQAQAQTLFSWRFPELQCFCTIITVPQSRVTLRRRCWLFRHAGTGECCTRRNNNNSFIIRFSLSAEKHPVSCSPSVCRQEYVPPFVRHKQGGILLTVAAFRGLIRAGQDRTLDCNPPPLSFLQGKRRQRSILQRSLLSTDTLPDNQFSSDSPLFLSSFLPLFLLFLFSDRHEAASERRLPRRHSIRAPFPSTQSRNLSFPALRTV